MTIQQPPLSSSNNDNGTDKTTTTGTDGGSSINKNNNNNNNNNSVESHQVTAVATAESAMIPASTSQPPSSSASSITNKESQSKEEQNKKDNAIISNDNDNTNKEEDEEPESLAVLAYLRKRGLGTAALELQKHMDDIKNNNKKAKHSDTNDTNANENGDKKAEDNDKKNKDNDDNKNKNKNNGVEDMDVDSKEVERKVEESKEKRSILNLTTGGGTGYDLDANSEIITWSGNKTTTSKTNKVHIETGDKDKDQDKEKDKNNGEKDQSENDNETKEKSLMNDKQQWEQDEATRNVRAFTALQTWVLSLPSDDNATSIETVLHHAKASAGLIDTMTNNDNDADEINNSDKGGTATPVSTSVAASTTTHIIPNSEKNTNTTSTTGGITSQHILSLTPQSTKPELLSLCFPLLIHTYCDLLEVGLEDTANALLSTYRHIHEPYHEEEFLDLNKCSSQTDIKRLQSLIKGYNEALTKAKKIRKLKDKLKTEHQRQQQQQSSASTSSNSTSLTEITAKMDSFDNEYKEVVEYYSECQRELKSFPFLKRARSVKWHVHLSALTFHMLVRFLHSGDGGGLELLPMNAMLQSRCHLVVENRDPIPYVPGFILEDMVLLDDKEGVNLIQDDESDKSNRKTADIRWAAPIDMTSRLVEAGENVDHPSSILKKSENLPFPQYYLKSQYATIDEYKDDKKKVEFNRAILTNGFRRLEALEAKREYEVGLRVNRGANPVDEDNLIGNPTEPSIMFSIICASSNKPVTSQQNGANFPLIESSIDLTCAKLCLPDGRHVAAGCTDSAVRVWSMQSWNSYSGKSTIDDSDGISTPRESTVVLVGHKKGLPIYDVDWNRDGRTLLSAGGDGTVRLWDSKAVGPFGKLASVTRRTTKASNLSKKTNKVAATEPDIHVPGAKPEPMVEQHGSALACYQGHAKGTPVWSVAMSPSGYYFASAGSDSTARLWCTDRPTPVRIFIGHYNQNVNCLAWHPNCNYLCTGSNDKTVRMWDVQSGRAVRILSGSKFGLNQVKVSPSGQYVAGADYSGTVSIWDLRNGRKLNEFRHVNEDTGFSPILHSMSYSPCGSTIATGGEDCSIRIWDARGLGDNTSNPEYAASVGWGHRSNQFTSSMTPKSRSNQPGKRDPVNTFYTSGSIILDLEFTKRNLLLSVGKYNPIATNVV